MPQKKRKINNSINVTSGTTAAYKSIQQSLKKLKRRIDSL